MEDGPGAKAQLALPNGIAISPDGGTLYTNDVAPGGRFQLRAIFLGGK